MACRLHQKFFEPCTTPDHTHKFVEELILVKNQFKFSSRTRLKCGIFQCAGILTAGEIAQETTSSTKFLPLNSSKQKLFHTLCAAYTFPSIIVKTANKIGMKSPERQIHITDIRLRTPFGQTFLIVITHCRLFRYRSC